MIRSLVRLVLVLAILLPTSAALSATTLVLPGPGTPIQDAIDAASPGDTIRLIVASYDECVVVTKPLKLRGVRSVAPLLADTTQLHGNCGAAPTVQVAADDVTVRGMVIFGTDQGGVDVVGRTHIKMHDLFVVAPSTAVAPAINVEQSTRVMMHKIWPTAFLNERPAGPSTLRIADIPAKGRIKVINSLMGGAVDGLLLSNVGDRAVKVTGSYSNGSHRGIALENVTGATLSRNFVGVNRTVGIFIGAGSSGNLIKSNELQQNGIDVVDNGSGNCWKTNLYTTGSVPPCP